MLDVFLLFFWFFICLNGVFVYGELGFNVEENIEYLLKVKMIGSNNEIEERGEIILLCEINILLVEN